MKRTIRYFALFAAITCAFEAGAQKKALDHDVYDTWQKVGDIRTSDDGRIIAYQITPGEGDGVLHIRKTSGKGAKTKVEEITIDRAQDASITPDGSFLFCRIKPQFAKVRSEKIKKVKADKQCPDTLAVVDLKAMEVKNRFAKVSSFTSGYESKPYLAFKTKSDTVLVLKPETGVIDTLTNVDRFAFNSAGDVLCVNFKKVKKSKDKPEKESALVLASRDKKGVLVLDTLSHGRERYGSPVFYEGDGMIAFTESTDTSKNRNKEFSLQLATRGKDGKYSVREIIAQGTKVEGTDNWTLNENSSVRFSLDGKRIFTGIASIRPPKDTTIHDFETAQLDIWNWDALKTPPQQKLDVNRIRNKTYSAVVNLSDGPCRIIPLTTKYYDMMMHLPGGNGQWAVSCDATPYTLTRDWDYNNKYDVELVSLTDGSTKPVVKGIDLGARSVSPTGKYLAWFDNADKYWYTYNVETGEIVNLTEKVGIPFHNVQYDMPGSPNPYDSSPQWMEGDKAIVIASRYDIWKFTPDGKSYECLTGGKGEAEKVVFRVGVQPQRRLSATERAWGIRVPLSAKGVINVTAHSDVDMTNGFGKITLGKKNTLVYSLDKFSYLTPTYSADNSTLVFRKGNFRNPYNLYVCNGDVAKAEKITSLETQMEPYRWGDVELIEWNAYDGTPLKGLVFIPDGVKDTDKLPVICYFYERNSETMYDFRMPAPSRSIINISFFTSRGYVVFVPDIVYVDGHPGECAYNCICSGAEAVCAKYPFADKSNMAIQGQSWGGYQTAYLITRTDMFVAAGAGAPVSNMTSAYGGIRWGSGMVRTGQYEHGQSRIGKTLWEEGGLDLYLENSPLFHLDKVKTPVLIMHNDNDGAVPWYQGIEMFSGLRRLGKPAWLLEYNREAHNLNERRNCKDYSVRLSQFFDYYMLGAPMPAWMKYGVPSDVKDEYFGFEPAE